MKTLTVDLGGTHLRVAIVEKAKILKLIEKETPKTKNDLLSELFKSIKECNSSEIKKIGISCAGFIDNGTIKVSPNLPLKNFNLKSHIQNKFKKRVEIENDANCVALAEAKYGVKKKNFFILTLGTGVGGGIIINGKLYKGLGGGGELGHIILNKGKELEHHFKKSKHNLEKLSDCLAQGIASLISVFDPEIVILSGGVTNEGNKLLNRIKSKTKKYMFLPRMPEIRFSSFENPGLIGAGLLFN